MLVANMPKAAIKLRNNIKGVNQKIWISKHQKRPYVYLDNAASTPMLNSVWTDVGNFLNWYSGVHRGTGYKSIISSAVYDACHDIIGRFAGADPGLDAVVMVKNTTEAINKLSFRLNLKRSDIVICTEMEHHSNDLPWRSKATVKYITVDDKGKLDYHQLGELLHKYYPRVKLLAVCGASNVTGHVNDVHAMAQIAHEYGCPILVDGAQLIPHRPFSMLSHHNPGHIDFLAFSGHKIYSPLGSGVLIAPRSLLAKGPPEYTGGGTVNLVFDDEIRWADPPDKEEAGSANVPGTFALARTLTYLQELGMSTLAQYEESLTAYTLSRLQAMPGVKVYGDQNRVGVISFNIEGLHHALVGAILCFEGGIGIRTGCFCAQKYVRILLNMRENKAMVESTAKHNYPGMVRVSLAPYNTRAEVDHLLHWLTLIRDNATTYQKLYRFSPQYQCYYPINRDDKDIRQLLSKYLAT